MGVQPFLLLSDFRNTRNVSALFARGSIWENPIPFSSVMVAITALYPTKISSLSILRLLFLWLYSRFWIDYFENTISSSTTTIRPLKFAMCNWAQSSLQFCEKQDYAFIGMDFSQRTFFLLIFFSAYKRLKLVTAILLSGKVR